MFVDSALIIASVLTDNIPDMIVTWIPCIEYHIPFTKYYLYYVNSFDKYLDLEYPLVARIWFRAWSGRVVGRPDLDGHPKPHGKLCYLSKQRGDYRLLKIIDDVLED